MNNHVQSSRTKNNYVGRKFGSLTVLQQYYSDNQGPLKVDYRCDCGEILTNRPFSKVKRQKMCRKCKSTNRYKILPFGETSFNLLYSSYIKSAKERGLNFNLSKQEFRFLTKQKCLYCGDLPHSVIRPNSIGGAYVYNGIDRKDNSKGYARDNCVPACKTCNYAKLKSSVDDFLDHVKKIYEYQFPANEELDKMNRRVEALRKAVVFTRQTPDKKVSLEELVSVAESFYGFVEQK
jgi:hypothetical protein